MNKKDIIKNTKDRLDELGIYHPYKDVSIEVYAQTYVDWMRAVKDADKFGEINESKNGMTQVNAYHTQKNHYSAQLKQWQVEMFKLDKVTPKKKDDSTRLAGLLQGDS